MQYGHDNGFHGDVMGVTFIPYPCHLSNAASYIALQLGICLIYHLILYSGLVYLDPDGVLVIFLYYLLGISFISALPFSLLQNSSLLCFNLHCIVGHNGLPQIIYGRASKRWTRALRILYSALR